MLKIAWFVMCRFILKNSMHFFVQDNKKKSQFLQDVCSWLLENSLSRPEISVNVSVDVMKILWLKSEVAIASLFRQSKQPDIFLLEVITITKSP